jgi:hypothetical protein
MRSTLRASASVLSFGLALAASPVLAADDPYAPPPPVTYQAPPPVTYQAPPPVTYQQPPPVAYQAPPVAQPVPQQQQPGHAGIFFRGRLGPSFPTLGPLASAGAPGGAISGVLGFQAREGYSGAIEVGGRTHFGDGGGAFGLHGALTLRYTALPALAIHPVIEGTAGYQYFYVWHSNAGTGGDSFNYYLSGALGLEYDLTPSLSIELLVRGDLLPSGVAWGGSPPSSAWAIDLAITPVLGVSLYL